ncbi:hypothetical protein GCM10011613_11670 [Cellvibrio zantedeschiae]|uniref:Uncharacterized protein n=1 Tax=Cellvibrio zantedeschiae TaxID=1237077 RepID=A0ABQ3AVG6_9GAMM|nr:hypothetical protein [Cellvibrio zantedeschiae]GGY69021.1 hypothetical protein GCM10011613_11670 [Cellvibrio zantedeschiae]
MVDTKIKTKAAMLNELESIKGLLLEEDDIPILQEVEVIDQQVNNEAASSSYNEKVEAEPQPKPSPRIIVEEQQDFFNSPTHDLEDHQESASELLDTIDELEKHTAEVTANKFPGENHKSATRPSLAKATGENPFLPAHIRSRLHGNNPPPLFAQETARKIASSSVPSRLLGNTSSFSSNQKPNNSQQELIDSIIEKLMPDIEKELRSRLELMSKQLLDELNKH